jgi:hypothetical protein
LSSFANPLPGAGGYHTAPRHVWAGLLGYFLIDDQGELPPGPSHNPIRKNNKYQTAKGIKSLSGVRVGKWIHFARAGDALSCRISWCIGKGHYGEATYEYLLC